MNVIAIDTATETLSVSILRNDGRTLSFSMNMGYRHGELLVPWIETILKQAEILPRELGLVICASGPGSFTGLRIGIATAKGLSIGASCPLSLVSTLDALAFGRGFFHGLVMPVIDAKKNRFYTAIYEDGKLISDYLDISASDFAQYCANEKEVLLCGPGAHIVFESLQKLDLPHIIKIDPMYNQYDSQCLLTLGLHSFAENPSGSADTEGPLYVRKSEAEIGIVRKE